MWYDFQCENTHQDDIFLGINKRGGYMENNSLREKVRKYATNKFTIDQINDQFIKRSSTQSSELREMYIQRFVRDQSYYQNYIIDTEPSTQLWNSLCFPGDLMDINGLMNEFPLSNNLFMFWDFPLSNDPMFKLGREYVFQISSEQLLNCYMKFPSDTYFFDENFEKTLLITHEDFNYDEQQFIVLKYNQKTKGDFNEELFANYGDSSS